MGFLELSFKRFPKSVTVILTEIVIEEKCYPKLSATKAGVKEDNCTAAPGSTRPCLREGNEK